MYKPHIRPIRDIQDNYDELDEIVNNRDHVIITHNGRNSSVLIGIEEYPLYEAFLHNLYIERKLDEAEASAADPNTQWIDEETFWAEIEAAE